MNSNCLIMLIVVFAISSIFRWLSVSFGGITL